MSDPNFPTGVDPFLYAFVERISGIEDEDLTEVAESEIEALLADPDEDTDDIEFLLTPEGMIGIDPC